MRTGFTVQLCHQIRDDAGEQGSLFLWNRSRDRQRHSHWILRRTIDTEFEVQMRTCCQSCAADITNHVNLAYLRSYTNAFLEAVHVSIERGDSRAMLNDHDISVSSLFFRQNDSAIASSLDRRAASRCIVGTIVRSNLVKDRLTTLQVEW